MKKELPSLILCIVFDIIGYASFAVPGLGELSDIVWAPISGLIFYKMFGGAKGAFGGIFSFIEEILPFTDFIPTFSIMWLWQYFTSRKTVNQPRKEKIASFNTAN
ncbi:MAG TPA: hypothetical protein VF623_05380 [Segetibacter sp.]|jgi:hypothetical protein